MHRSGLIRSTDSFTLLLSLFGLVILIPLFFVPVTAVLSRAFVSEGGSFSLQPLLKLVSSVYVRRIIGFTLLQALLSTAAALIIGLPGAYILSQYRFRGRMIIRAVSSIPFVLPSIIVVLGFVIFYGNNGYLNRLLMLLFSLESPPLKILYTFKAIILAHGFYNFPIILSIVAGYWEQSSETAEAAARTLGAGPLRLFFTVTLPKLKPAVLSASALVFLFCFTSFAVILVLGGGPQFTTVEVEIYRQARISLDMETAAGLALLSILITSVLLLLYIKTQSGMRTERAGFRLTVTPAAVKRPKAPPAARVGILLYTTAAAFFAGAPVIAVILRSFQSQATRSAETVLSLRWYRDLFTAAQGVFSQGLSPGLSAFSNSFTIALFALLIAVPAALGLSYLARSPLVHNSALPELLFMMPLAVSSIILGLGYFFISFRFSSPAVNRVLIVCAHTVIVLPFILRSILPSVQHLHGSCSAAAMLLGAGPVRTFFTIELPVLKSSIISGAIFGAAISLGEMNATLMLAGENTLTIPLLLYRLIGSYQFYAACAVGTLLMLLCTGLFVLFELLRENV